MKYKKPALITLILIVVLVGILGINYTLSFRTRSFNSIIKCSTNKVDKIDIMNGSNGEITTITDEKKIKDICSYFSNLKFKKIITPSSSGWSYSFTFYSNSVGRIDITFNGTETCSINLKSKYDVINSNKTSIDSIFNKYQKQEK